MGGLYNSRHDAAMIMIFLKWFDVDNQCIRGQRAIYVNRHDKTGRLTSIVAEMMNWKAEQGEPPVTIVFYEEIKPGMIEPLKPNATFVLSEIQDGDIICFMRGQSTKRSVSLEIVINGRLDELIKEGKYPDPARYYEFLHNKITLRFMPRYSDQIVKEDFQCVLAKTMKYEQVRPVMDLIDDRLRVKWRNV
jgi:ubiquitin carboxyl-terminal hydrolase 7